MEKRVTNKADWYKWHYNIECIQTECKYRGCSKVEKESVMINKNGWNRSAKNITWTNRENRIHVIKWCNKNENECVKQSELGQCRNVRLITAYSPCSHSHKIIHLIKCLTVQNCRCCWMQFSMHQPTKWNEIERTNEQQKKTESETHRKLIHLPPNAVSLCTQNIDVVVPFYMKIA